MSDIEFWSAQGDPVYERFSLWPDGTLVSEHMDCGVRLTVGQLRALASSAIEIAARLEADAAT